MSFADFLGEGGFVTTSLFLRKSARELASPILPRRFSYIVPESKKAEATPLLFRLGEGGFGPPK